MAASGINDRTRMALDKFLDQCFGRAKVKAQLISGEMISNALTDLDLLLKNLSATGVQLWCYERITAVPVIGSRKIAMPEGTDDIDRVSLRQQNILAPLSIKTNAVDVTALMGAAGYPAPGSYSPVTYTFVTAAAGGEYDFEVAFLKSQPRTLAVSYSSDGTTFSTPVNIGDPTVLGVIQVSKQPITFSISIPTGTVAIKLDDTTNTPMDPLNFKVIRGGSETPMSPVGEGEYHNLGDALRGGSPSQYMVDRNVDTLSLMPFPIFDATSAHNTDLVIWRKRHVMDVGRPTNTLDMPSRWYEPIVWALAWRIAFREPEAGIRWSDAKAIADEYEMKTAGTERVQGKIRMRFNS